MSTEPHSALSPLSWLFGVWEAVEAEACYPTMDTAKYSEVLEFQPRIEPALDYKSETRHNLDTPVFHCEKGYLRIDPDSQKVTFLLAHNLGLTEISEGSVDKECLNLESISLTPMPLAAVAACKKIVRKLELKGEELHSTMMMQTVTHPLQLHLKCRYRKKKN